VTNASETRFERLRPQQIWDALAAFPCTYVPSGPLEWHGRQNPIGLDFLKAHALCLRAAAATGGLVFPPVCLAAQAVPWPLGMPVAQELVQRNATTVLRYLARNGVRAIVWLSGHGGPEDYLEIRRASLAVMHEAEVAIYAVVDQHVISDRERSMDHGAAIETSLMHRLCPETVELGALDSRPEIAPEGVGGQDPRTHASAALGREYADLLVERLAEVARRLVATADPVARRQHRQCVAQQVAVDDMVVYSRASLARAHSVDKFPTHAWVTHYEAYRLGDYAAALQAGTEVIEWARQRTAGKRPAGTEYERIA